MKTKSKAYLFYMVAYVLLILPVIYLVMKIIGVGGSFVDIVSLFRAPWPIVILLVAGLLSGLLFLAMAFPRKRAEKRN